MFHFLTRRERCINTYPAKIDDCTSPPAMQLSLSKNFVCAGLAGHDFEKL